VYYGNSACRHACSVHKATYGSLAGLTVRCVRKQMRLHYSKCNLITNKSLCVTGLSTVPNLRDQFKDSVAWEHRKQILNFRVHFLFYTVNSSKLVLYMHSDSSKSVLRMIVCVKKSVSFLMWRITIT
jgi:hypothetical protein